jgi:hypothetical protein
LKDLGDKLVEQATVLRTGCTVTIPAASESQDVEHGTEQYRNFLVVGCEPCLQGIATSSTKLILARTALGGTATNRAPPGISSLLRGNHGALSMGGGEEDAALEIPDLTFSHAALSATSIPWTSASPSPASLVVPSATAFSTVAVDLACLCLHTPVEDETISADPDEHSRLLVPFGVLAKLGIFDGSWVSSSRSRTVVHHSYFFPFFFF